MKYLYTAVTAMSIAASGCNPLPEAELERGGVTFDFRKISDERFRIPLPGDPGNLVDGSPWTGGENQCGFHGVKTNDFTGLRKNAASAIEWKSDSGVYSIVKKPEMEKIIGEKTAAKTSAQFVKTVALPSSGGGNYRVSFRYKAAHKYLRAQRSSYLLMYFKKRDAKSGRWVRAENIAVTGGTYYGYPLTDTDGNWSVYSKEFKLKPGCEALEMIMRIDGVGTMSFKDFGLVETGAEGAKERLELSPHGELGGDFEISQGQVGGIGLMWKHDVRTVYKKSSVVFSLSLPAGFSFIGSSFGDPSTVKSVSRGDGSTVTSFAMANRFDLRWVEYNRMTALVKSTGAVGDGGKARFSVKVDGKEAAAPVDFVLRTSPSIQAVAPERYFNGIFPSGTSVYFGDTEADGAFAGFIGACGVRWVITNKATDDIVAAWREAGVKHVTPELGVSNGYFFGVDANIPEGDRFKASPTTEDWRLSHDKAWIANGFCPQAIIEERPYVVTNSIEKMIAGRFKVKGVDGGWSNWEPFMYETRGCVCEKCLRAYEEWKKKNPSGTVQAFRSELHGEVVRTIDRHVRKNGGKIGMIPGVSWREGCSAWRENYGNGEVKPVDYAGDLEWINFWGPYVYWDAQSPYGRTERSPLWHFLLARDIRENTDREYAAGRRPKLMAFPHGLEGRSWVTQPEHFAMACDSFFFNRWDATVGYFFPQGYDARFWRAFAEATSRAALCEKFVLDGERRDTDCSLETVPEYEKRVSVEAKYTPVFKDQSLLQHAAYDYKGSRIVSALNFSDDIDAFFVLKARGLEGDFVITDEHGVRYRPNRWRGVWSAEELAAGVMLYAGAARTRVFFITPENSPLAPVAVSSLTEEKLRGVYASRRKELRERLDKAGSDSTEKIVRPKYRFD